MGQVSTTINGIQCQNWSSTEPHNASSAYTDNQFPDGSRAAAENYCRNPDPSRTGVWCYTMDPVVRWEYCDVPYCLRKSVSAAGTCSSVFIILLNYGPNLTEPGLF